MGQIIERTRTKEGKARPWLLVFLTVEKVIDREQAEIKARREHQKGA